MYSYDDAYSHARAELANRHQQEIDELAQKCLKQDAKKSVASALLTFYGRDRKITAIRTLKHACNLGLKEAKDLIDSVA